MDARHKAGHVEEVHVNDFLPDIDLAAILTPDFAEFTLGRTEGCDPGAQPGLLGTCLRARRLDWSNA